MTDISPMSRDEKLLRRILGQSIEIEEPQSRIEVLLKTIIDEGGIGGGAYEVKGSYATLADLESAHPTGNAGDAYLVGDPSHIYVWLTDANEWHDGGAFSAIAGPQGNGIVSIVKTGTSGLVDTYTITYDNGDTDTFDITNGEDGVGITNIAKTSTAGLVDTYTITLSDGSTYTFTVTNGSEGTLPEGGTTGQVLAKKSNADGDVEWVNQSGGSDVSSELESLSNQTSELASETGLLSSENSQQQSEINSLSSENSTQTSELTSLSQSMSELASAAASQSTSQSQIDSTQDVALASLSTENSTQTSEIGSMASEMASMSVSDITSQLTSLSTENSTQESEIGSLAAVDSSHNSELGSLSQSMSELASAASSTSAAQSEIDLTQDGSISSLASENSTQTSEIGSLSTAESELASEVAVIGSEVAEKQDALVEGPGIDIDSSTNEIKTETVIFTGTLEEWEALSLVDKIKFTHAVITNDTQSGIIDLVPTENSMHAVASGGVYDKLAETAKKATPNTFVDVNAFKKAVFIQSSYDVTEQPAQVVWGDAYIQFIDKNGQRAGFITTEQNTDGTIDMRANMDNGKFFMNDQEVNGATYGLTRIANKLGLKIGTVNVSGTYDANGNILIENGHNSDHLYIEFVNDNTASQYDSAPIILVSRNGNAYLHGINNTTPDTSVSGIAVSGTVYYIDLS